MQVEQAFFSAPARFLLLLAAFVVVIAGMQAAASLLIPFLLSLFIAVIAASPMFFLQNKGLPDSLALVIVVSVIILLGALLGWLIGGSVDNFIDNLPKYQQRLAVQSADLSKWLQSLGVAYDHRALTGFFNPGKALALAGQLLNGLGGVLAQAFLILITVIFMLLEATSFQAKLETIAEQPEASLARFKEISGNIRQYMMLKTATSFLTGVLVALWLLIFDVDYPVLWGVLAFLFNYVPNIGSIIAAIPAVLLALVQLGPEAAFWTIVGYLLVNNLVGNLIEPRFMGRGLGLSPLIVFVSLVFWGWVLGPVGMFLSVPLTMTLKIILEANQETKPVAQYLS